MSREDDGNYLSEGGSDAEGAGFPEPGGEVVEFGWQDEKKPLTGRRKKTQQAAKKRAKAGTFGEP